jgi:hypothetical protein
VQDAECDPSFHKDHLATNRFNKIIRIELRYLIESERPGERSIRLWPAKSRQANRH